MLADRPPRPYDPSRMSSVGTRPLVPSRLGPARRPGSPPAETSGPEVGSFHGSRREAKTVVGAYIALTKPRIIELLLITTLPAMVLAERGWPPAGLIVATLIGGTLAAGGANAFNMYVDRDIDRLMRRTANRPLVTGVVAPRDALIFAVALEVLAFAVLWTFTNLLSACLALAATGFYVFVYTMWLKRTSTQNIVIGGAAGAVPVLVGWSAVTNSLAWPPVVLFVVIFLWTPPHFWALAIRYVDDYRAAGVPMLPAVAPVTVATHKMVTYTVGLVGASLVLWPVADLGWIYGVAALIVGAIFLVGVIDLGRRPSAARSMRVFGYSITYVTLLFGALTVDVLVRYGL
jgi:protoheme IX farnesyltransferase